MTVQEAIDATAAGPVDTLALSSFVVYMALVVGIGIWASRFSSTGLGQFFLAGRGLGRFVVALSAVSSGRSGWLLLGFSGMAYARGASAVWMVVGYIVVEFLLFWTYARRLRRLSGAGDCITVPDVFAARFPDGGASLRLVLVAVFLVFMTPYVGAQFVAGGKAFHSSFGLDPTLGNLLTAAIVLAYTVLGGFLAVSLTDVVQACFMLFALIAVPALAITGMGGMGAVGVELAQLDPTLVDPFALGAGALIGSLGIGLGSPGNPHILVRYMSISSAEHLRGAAVIGTVWNVLMAGGALLIGLVGRAWFGDVSMLPGGDQEAIYPMLAQEHLHPILFGVVIASIFAAIMSTADSQLLVAASAVTRDVYEQLLHRGGEIDPHRLVRISRGVVVALVVLALVVALTGGGVVNKLVLYAWGGLGAALGPTSILMLYWRRTTAPGVLAGMITGAATLILWEEFGTPAIYGLVPAFGAGLFVTVLVSLVTRPPAGVEENFALMRTPARVPAPDAASADQ